MHLAPGVPDRSSGIIRFSESYYKCLSRGGARTGKVAAPEQIAAALAGARHSMAIAGDELVAEVQRRSPESFRVVTDPRTGQVAALLAYLPLNEHGAAELVSGGFDGKSFDPELVLAQSSPPAALYLWLLWAPSSLAAGLGLLDTIVAEMPSCPLFSRGATDVTEGIHLRMGFLRARDLYPSAPGWLLTVPPAQEMRAPASVGDAGYGRTSANIEVKVARSLDDLMQVFAVRSMTYLTEQLCPYREEFDGNDFSATHILATLDGEIAGCARIRWFGDFAKIERVAVRKTHRKSRLAARIARFSIEHCRRKGFSRIYAHSRADLVPMWRMYGMRPVTGRSAFSFSGIEFREVACDLQPDPLAIRFGTDPLITIRPEGAWELPGPLEAANSNGPFAKGGADCGIRRLRERRSAAPPLQAAG